MSTGCLTCRFNYWHAKPNFCKRNKQQLWNYVCFDGSKTGHFFWPTRYSRMFWEFSRNFQCEAHTSPQKMAKNPKIVIFVTLSGQSPRSLVCSNLAIWGFLGTVDKCLCTLVSIFPEFSVWGPHRPSKWLKTQKLSFLWHRPVKAPGCWFVHYLAISLHEN